MVGWREYQPEHTRRAPSNMAMHQSPLASAASTNSMLGGSGREAAQARISAGSSSRAE
jgi:hypothetical protein